MIFGATANFVAVWLVAWTGSVYSVSAFTAISGLIGFLATLGLKDHSNEALADVGVIQPLHSSPMAAGLAPVPQIVRVPHGLPS
jgi:hypothetical protein